MVTRRVPRQRNARRGYWATGAIRRVDGRLSAGGSTHHDELLLVRCQHCDCLPVDHDPDRSAPLRLERLGAHGRLAPLRQRIRAAFATSRSLKWGPSTARA